MRIHPSPGSAPSFFEGLGETPPVGPAKRAALQVELTLEGGAALSLDPTRWRFRTRRDLDGHRALIVSGPELHRLQPDLAHHAAALAVDCLLGQEERRRRYDALWVEPLSPNDGLPFTALR